MGDGTLSLAATWNAMNFPTRNIHRVVTRLAGAASGFWGFLARFWVILGGNFWGATNARGPSRPARDAAIVPVRQTNEHGT